MAKDQAERLRERLNKLKNEAKTIAVMSGKGGVGKSNFSLNFSLALQKQNKRVLLFDLDIGMGNIDILIGESSKYSIVDFFKNDIALLDIITSGASGLDYISGGTGLGQIFKLEEERFQEFLQELSLVFKVYDYIIFDMGAGISEDSLRFILSVEEIIVITTPEPTSITDAYAAIKHICYNDERIPFSIIVNRAFNTEVGEQTFNRLSQTIKQFLKRDSKLLGVIPDDSVIMKAVIEQQPFLNFQPNSRASKALTTIAKDFLTEMPNRTEQVESTQFISRLKSFFMKGRS